MNTSYPCFQVNDIETTIEWYEQFLNYQCTYKSSIKSPDYVLLENNNQKLYLVKNEDQNAYASNILIVEVPDLEKEYAKLEECGVIFYQQLGEGFFGDNEFIIKDYEDNKLIYRQK